MPRMAIQFLCPSCKQPIEVDSSWASKTVACPYCRGTVTAPNASTLDAQEIHLAAPLSSAAPRYTAPPSTNPLALVAFGLTLLMALFFTISTYTIVAHSLEFEELTKEIHKHGSGPSSQIRAWTEYMNANNGQVPTWMIVAALFQTAGMALCLASLICGIISLRHQARRGLAVASVVACGLVIGLMFISVLTAFA